MPSTTTLSTLLLYTIPVLSLTDPSAHLLARRSASILSQRQGGTGTGGTCASVYGGSYKPCGPNNCYDPGFEICCGDGSFCIQGESMCGAQAATCCVPIGDGTCDPIPTFFIPLDPLAGSNVNNGSDPYGTSGSGGASGESPEEVSSLFSAAFASVTQSVASVTQALGQSGGATGATGAVMTTTGGAGSGTAAKETAGGSSAAAGGQGPAQTGAPGGGQGGTVVAGGVASVGGVSGWWVGLGAVVGLVAVL